MKSMLFYELKKMFGIKKTSFCAGAALLLLFATFFGRAFSFRLFEEQPEIKKRLDYASGEVTNDRFDEDEKRFKELANNPGSDNSFITESSNQVYENIFDGGEAHQDAFDMLESILYIKRINEMPQKMISGLQKEMADPAVSHAQSLLIQKNIAMLSKKGNLVIAYNLFYDYYNNFLTSLFPYLIGFLVIFFIAPIFAGEYSARMDSLILSSRKGKRGIIIAKFLASFIAITLIFAFVMGAYILICGLILGFTGGESSFLTMYSDLFQYMGSPYNLTMLQFLLCTLAISYASCIGFGVFAMFVSANSRSTLITFSVCLAAFHVPLLLTAFNSSYPPAANLAYGRIAQAAPLLESFHGFVAFGKVVMLKEAALLCLAVFSVLFALCGWRSFKTHQAAN